MSSTPYVIDQTQARELLRAYERAEPSALALVEQYRPQTERAFALADAHGGWHDPLLPESSGLAAPPLPPT